MKVRKNKATRPTRKVINPLRVDPSRTATLRRVFCAAINRKFALLKKVIRRLVLEEDAFGLKKKEIATSNVFCPTGEGGGIDPSCSPSSKSTWKRHTDGKWRGNKPRTFYRATTAGGSRVVTKSADWDNNLFVADNISATIPYGDTVERIEAKPEAKILYEGTKEFKDIGKGLKKNQLSMLDFGTEIVRRAKAQGYDAVWFELQSTVGTAIINPDKFIQGLSSNVFCPTGEGGGVDPSCSPLDVKFDSDELFMTHFNVDGKQFVFDAQYTGDGEVNQWALSFGRSSEEETYRTKMTHDPSVSPIKVLRAVQQSMHRFIQSQKPDEITFSADTREPSRVVLYDRVAKEIGKHYGYEVSSRRRPGSKQYILKKLPVDNTRFAFSDDPEKVTAFRYWLKHQLQQNITGVSDQQLWASYVQQAFNKGQGRAFDDVRRRSKRDERLQAARQEFLLGQALTPATASKVRLLVERVNQEMAAGADDTANKMSRVLADGIVAGKSPREVAAVLDEQLEIGRVRANTIARTEMIRSHAEGQLDAMERLGVAMVGAAVEWDVTNDSKVCPKCKPLDGVVLTVKQARGLLPRHPNAVFAGSSFAPYGECEELVRAWYDGPSIVLTLRSGLNRTTIGPNHPIMTRRGMVPAAQLREGDYVLYDSRKNGLSVSRDVDEVPAIENIFESLLEVTGYSGIVPSASDLHGDRVFCKGEVQAIRPARGLLVEFDSFGVEELREIDFAGTDSHLEFVSGFGPLKSSSQSVFLTSPSGVRKSGPLRVGVGSKLNSHPFKPQLNSTAVDLEPLFEGAQALPGEISLPNFFQWERVHSVSSGRYQGWAFDATTATSLYYSGGLVVSNCRCAWLPADMANKQLGQVTAPKRVEKALKKSKGDDEDWGPVENAFDPSQPRDEQGRWTDSGGGDFSPKVYVSDDPKKYGKQQYDLTTPNGAPVRGKPISPDDPTIPDTVYHMTTNLPAVQASGYLRAAGEGGLGGDKRDQIVSMTISKDIAEQLVKDTKWAAALIRRHGKAPAMNWNSEKSEWETTEREKWGRALVAELVKKSKEDDFKFEPIDLQVKTYGFGDWLTQYFTLREGQTVKQGRRPLLDPQFWDAENTLSKVDPNKVGLIRIPKSHLKTGAMLTDFDLDNRFGLKEVRLYGDVPLNKAPTSNTNCGIGEGGFLPGNTCGKGKNSPLTKEVMAVLKELLGQKPANTPKGIDIKVADRTIRLQPNDKNGSVDISFFQDKLPEQPSTKQKEPHVPEHTTSATLQQGSIALAKRLKSILGGLASRGINVEYVPADERRERAYKQAMQAAGFREISDGLWMPSAVRNKEVPLLPIYWFIVNAYQTGGSRGR